MPTNDTKDENVQNEPDDETGQATVGGLGLAPNEVIGYRIIPDEHNWTVALVRKHGSGKHVGEEYATSLAYCASLEYAALWILGRDARMKTEMHGLMEAMRLAKEEAVKAVVEVSRRLTSGEIALPSHSPILNRATREKEEAANGKQ